MTARKSSPPAPDVVTLADLAPRQDVNGGSHRRLFGSEPALPADGHSRSGMAEPTPAARQTTDLRPKSAASVKGGKLASNANSTLGREARDQTQDNWRDAMKATKASAKAKDLPAKSGGNVKGGGKTTGFNDNITLLRAAKPASTKKDLPAGKDVKGGKKRN